MLAKLNKARLGGPRVRKWKIISIALREAVMDVVQLL